MPGRGRGGQRVTWIHRLSCAQAGLSCVRDRGVTVVMRYWSVISDVVTSWRGVNVFYKHVVVGG